MGYESQNKYAYYFNDWYVIYFHAERYPMALVTNALAIYVWLG